jgi:hemolysin D
LGLRHRRQPLRDGAGKSEPPKPGVADGAAAEPAYAARVSLDQTQMQIDDKLPNVLPGMAVTVEIKTGTRRIITKLN